MNYSLLDSCVHRTLPGKGNTGVEVNIPLSRILPDPGQTGFPESQADFFTSEPWEESLHIYT